MKKWIGISLYIIGLLGVVELGGYIVVSLADNNLGNESERHLFSPVRGHELNPNYRRDSDTKGALIHSKQGFRREGEISVTKPANTIRIFVMGGSALYGIGVQQDNVFPKHRTLFNDETVPHFLEKELNRHFAPIRPGLKIEVINAGVTAYHTFQHVFYLYESLYEFAPDIVVFFDGHNDFYSTTVHNPVKSYGYSSVNFLRAINEREPFVGMYTASRFLGDYSHFFKLLEKVFYRLFERYEGQPHNIEGIADVDDREFAARLKSTATRSFIRAYKMTQALGHIHGFDTQVFLQPEVVFERDEWLSPHDREIKATTEKWYKPGVSRNMNKARPLFPDFFKEAGIGFHDVAEIAGESTKNESLYLDYCHLSPKGSAIAARKMLPRMVKMVEKKLGIGQAEQKGPAEVPTTPSPEGEPGTLN